MIQNFKTGKVSAAAYPARFALVALLIRFPLSLGLIFLITALLRAAFKMPLDLSRTGVLFPFLLGLVGGTAFFSLLWKFSLLYVFSHELTHWLAAKLFRRRTGRFQIGFNSGNVEIERPNLWITLSPYFVPLYTLIWSGLYFSLRQFQPLLVARFSHLAVGGIGLTYAYHLWMTAFAFTREQQDLKMYGIFFSTCLVLFVNLLLVFLAILAVTGEWREGFNTFLQLLREQTQFLHNLPALIQQKCELAVAGL